VWAYGRVWLIVALSSLALLALAQAGPQLTTTAYAATMEATTVSSLVQYLPWTAGQRWAVSQGNAIVINGTCVGGCFSHNDAYDRYAWDFYDPSSPGGQPVLAAAPGVVAAVINDVSKSSYVPGSGCTSYRANEVLLQYNDGTYGLYLHLMQEPRYAGVGNNGWVHVGQHVAQGQELGRTGATGCATGPHLHYSRMAYQTINGSLQMVSIPSTFADVPGGIPQQGMAYVSGNRGSTSQPGPAATPTPAPTSRMTPTPTPVGIEVTPTPLIPGPTDWPTFQHDQARSGDTTSPQITTANAATLAQRWLFSTVPGVIQAAPAIAANTVFVGLTNGFFYAINLRDGSLRWSYAPSSGSPYACLSTPDVAAGLVFFTSCNGYLYALNAATGKLAWQYQATRTTSSALTTPAPVHDEHNVYVVTPDGQISALDLHTGMLAWHVQLPGAAIGSPALANERIYITVNTPPGAVHHTNLPTSALYALDIHTGHTLWSWTPNTASLTSTPVFSRGVLYVGDQQGNITALDANAGHMLWQRQAGGTITAAPAIDASSVYVAAQNGMVAAMDPLTGVTQWAASLPAALEAAPAVSGNVLFLADDSGMLRALDSSNGAQLWAEDVGAPSSILLSSPAIADATVVIGGSALSAFSPPSATATTPTPTATPTLASSPTAAATLIPTPTPTVAASTATPQPTPTVNSADRATIIAEITTVFGPYATDALKVAACESGYNAFAYNPTPVGSSHAEGVFQILYPSTWNTTPYRHASPYNALTNIQAAYFIFQHDGYSWREWECQP